MAFVTCFVLCLLVAGSQCAPAKLGIGGEVGGSAEGSLTGGLSGQLGYEDGVLKPGAKALVGTNGQAGVHGGGFARYNDNILAGNAEAHARGGLLGTSKFDGELGYNKDRGLVLGGTNKLSGAADGKAGASGNLATNEDALGHVRVYGERSALDELRGTYH